jgi:two-component system response regulator ResD
MQTTILIADDEERIRRLVGDYLKKDGFTIVEAEDGTMAVKLFQDNPGINLAILDVMMPGYDGWSVLRKIRESSTIPVIMLTARGEEHDQLFGYELGTDEYVTKPFSPRVLTARVRALLNRSGVGSSDTLELGMLSVDHPSHRVTVNGDRVELSPQEYKLLFYLVEHAGVVMSRDQILHAVWDINYYGDGRTVDTHVKRLRKKLGAAGDYVQTVRGFGYRFEVME